MRKICVLFVLVGLSGVGGKAITFGQINPDCPNGCLTTPGHCWCYQYYPFKEAPGEATNF